MWVLNYYDADGSKHIDCFNSFTDAVGAMESDLNNNSKKVTTFNPNETVRFFIDDESYYSVSPAKSCTSID